MRDLGESYEVPLGHPALFIISAAYLTSKRGLGARVASEIRQNACPPETLVPLEEL